jgi:hypothetical protein
MWIAVLFNILVDIFIWSDGIIFDKFTSNGKSFGSWLIHIKSTALVEFKITKSGTEKNRKLMWDYILIEIYTYFNIRGSKVREVCFIITRIYRNEYDNQNDPLAMLLLSEKHSLQCRAQIQKIIAR